MSASLALPLLQELQSLPTSGARAVEPFSIGSEQYLAVPQLASDVPAQPARVEGGDSDLPVLIFRLNGTSFEQWRSLPASGGEDVEHFEIEGEHFLAVACLRSGKGPYNLNVDSKIYKWSGEEFLLHQSVPTFAAKQWRYCPIAGRHFLALAQGVVQEGAEPTNPHLSTIFEWDGRRFKAFQTVDSAWGYNWHHFQIGSDYFLAYADHKKPSLIFRWSGRDFEKVQTLEGESGRAFCAFQAEGEHFLAFARLMEESVVLRWDGTRFVHHQTLSGPGGREFAYLEKNGAKYLIQVNFLTGSREQPKTDLESYVYRWNNRKMERIEGFPTKGGTDVAAIAREGETYIAVSESLSVQVRFRTDSHLYSFNI